MSDAVIEAIGVTKRFGGQNALTGFDWHVPRGAISGLVGPNGAGKTTLFSLVAGFLRPTAGVLSVLGMPPSEIGRRPGRLAILPQDATFDVNVPILEQLRFLARLGGLDAAAAAASADRALEQVGLGRARFQAAQTLSHGMFKRFGIAQALVGSPDVILLDEPTAGLDPENAHQVREIVRGLRGRATLVVSSHNLAEIQDLCDHLAVMRAGRLVAQGATAELVGAGELLRLELGADAARLEPSLAALPGVLRVAVEGGGRRLQIRYDAKATTGDAVTRAVLERVLREELPVLSLSRGASLESRFLELTREGEAALGPDAPAVAAAAPRA